MLEHDSKVWDRAAGQIEVLQSDEAGHLEYFPCAARYALTGTLIGLYLVTDGAIAGGDDMEQWLRRLEPAVREVLDDREKHTARQILDAAQRLVALRCSGPLAEFFAETEDPWPAIASVLRQGVKRQEEERVRKRAPKSLGEYKKLRELVEREPEVLKRLLDDLRHTLSSIEAIDAALDKRQAVRLIASAVLAARVCEKAGMDTDYSSLRECLGDLEKRALATRYTSPFYWVLYYASHWEPPVLVDYPVPRAEGNVEVLKRLLATKGGEDA